VALLSRPCQLAARRSAGSVIHALAPAIR
jgi:hypothetical protein